jgi:hypothetical protein
MTYVSLSYLISNRGDAGCLEKNGTNFSRNFSRDASLRLLPPTFCPGPSLPVMTKFILVSGGVVSGIGKGVIGMRMQPHHHSPHV